MPANSPSTELCSNPQTSCTPTLILKSRSLVSENFSPHLWKKGTISGNSVKGFWVQRHVYF
jgi:hypothetical protein